MQLCLKPDLSLFQLCRAIDLPFCELVSAVFLSFVTPQALQLHGSLGRWKASKKCKQHKVCSLTGFEQ